ncbi:MAG: IS1595 family transposase [Tannerella sp.]|jgi:hypothetical protein|nr:IS1595 family transposase [Tannerella sp.]
MGFGSYETAWLWLHKRHRAMVRSGREKLSGEVEVEETYIGGDETGSGNTGRGAEEKSLVAVAIECMGKKTGRVRFKIIPDASSQRLLPFIADNVEQGSTVITESDFFCVCYKKNRIFVPQKKCVNKEGVLPACLRQRKDIAISSDVRSVAKTGG